MGAQVLDLGGASDSDSDSSGLGAAAIVDYRMGARAGPDHKLPAKPGAAHALPASLLQHDADAWLFSAAPAAALPPPPQGAGFQYPELEGDAGLAAGALTSSGPEVGGAELLTGSAVDGSTHIGVSPGDAMFANAPPPARDRVAALCPTTVFGNTLPPLTCDDASASPAAAMFANALPPPDRDDVVGSPAAMMSASALPSAARDDTTASPAAASMFAIALPPVAGPQESPSPDRAGAVVQAGAAEFRAVHGKRGDALADAAGCGGSGLGSGSGSRPRTLRGARRGLRFDDPAPPAFVLPAAACAAPGTATSPEVSDAAVAQRGEAERAEAPASGSGSPRSAASTSAEGDARSPRTPGGVPGKGMSAAGLLRTPAPITFTPARSVARREADPDPTLEKQMLAGFPRSWGVRLGYLCSQGLPASCPTTPAVGVGLGLGPAFPVDTITPPPVSSPLLGHAGLAGTPCGSRCAGIASRWLQAVGAAGASSPAAGAFKPFPGGRLRDAAPSARPAAVLAMWRRVALCSGHVCT